MTNENITITTDEIEQPAMMSAFGDGGMDVSPEEINPDAIIEAAEIVRDNEEPNSNTHVLVGGVLVAMAKEQKRVSQTTDTILNSETERQKSFEESQQERDEKFEEEMTKYGELPSKVSELERITKTPWDAFDRKSWFLNVDKISLNNSYKSVIIPVKGGDVIHFERNSTSKLAYYYIVTTLEGLPGTSINCATGFEGRQNRTPLDIIIPFDGKYILWLEYRTTQEGEIETDYTPSVATINGEDLFKGLKDTLNEVAEEIKTKAEKDVVDILSTKVENTENKVNRIDGAVALQTIYDSISKKKTTDGKFGAGTLTKNDDGTISFVKTEGVGSGWSGIYFKLDTDKEFIEGHNYYILFDVEYNSNTKSNINTTGMVRSGSTNIASLTPVDNNITSGNRKFIKFSIESYPSSTQGRIMFQVQNYAVTDDFDLKIYNILFVDLTEYSLTYSQLDEYIETYGALDSLSLIKEALHAKEADSAKSFKGNFKQARYDGKIGVLMGDSHTTRRAQWIAKVFDRMGATWDTETNTYIIGKSTNEVMDGYEDTCTPLMSQATRLIEKYNDGKNIDVIFIENVHYGISNNYTFDTAAPFKPKQIVNLGDYAQNVSEESAWFENNITSLIGGKTKKLGTLLKYTFRANCSKITFSGTPKAGTINLRVRGKDYPTNLSGNETLNEAVALIFANFNNLSYDKVTINNNTITFTPNDGVYQHYITVTSGTTGITGTQTQESGASVVVHRYFDSRDIANWNDPSHWYRLNYWNYGYGYLKGVVETLLEAMPKVKIVMLGLANFSQNEGELADDLGVDIVAWHTRREHTNSMKEAFLEVGKKYNLKTIDVDILSGLNPSNWFEFYNPGDVHPKPEGYDRWADVIIREMGV